MHYFDFNADLPGLLISVRSAAEARIALAGGADVIDVKEPNRGSLGVANAEVVAAVVAEVGGRVPISVAAGELLEASNSRSALAGVDYCKIGLARCRKFADWPVRWRATIRTWPANVRPVAVVYADWQLADAPPPERVLAEAVAVGCRVLLVDTWEKSRGGLFDLWPVHEVARFRRRAHEADVAVVLAGSLQGKSLAVAAECRPNLIAVRGAVCDGDRTGAISEERVRTVLAAVRRERAVAGDKLLSPPAARKVFSAVSAGDEGRSGSEFS